MFQLVWVRRVANSIDRQKIDFSSSRRGSLETRRLVSGALSRSRKITTVSCDSEASPVSHTSWRSLASALSVRSDWQSGRSQHFLRSKHRQKDLKTEVYVGVCARGRDRHTRVHPTTHADNSSW